MSSTNVLISLIIVLSCLGIVLCQFGYKLIKMHNDIKSIKDSLYKSINLNNITDTQTYKNDGIIGNRQFKANNKSNDSNIKKNTKNKLNTCKDYFIAIFAHILAIIRCIRINHK